MIHFIYYSRIGESSLHRKYCYFTSRNAPILTFSSEFFISSFPRLYLKRNSDIYKNFNLTNTNTIFFIQSFSLVSNYKLNSLLTPSFYKIQSLISFPLSSGITFLVCAVCFPSPHDADVGEIRLRDQQKECLCVRQGAGTTVLC